MGLIVRIIVTEPPVWYYWLVLPTVVLYFFGFVSLVVYQVYDALHESKVNKKKGKGGDV